MATKVDMYVNLITKTISASAANALTFDTIDVGLNIFDKVGLLICRLEYDVSGGTLADLDQDGDAVQFGLTSSNDITSLSALQSEVLDVITINRYDAGTAGNATFFDKPIIHDFSTLPGGGLLIAPKPLHVATAASGMSAPASAVLRLYFVMIQLTDADYLELLQTRRAFG